MDSFGGRIDGEEVGRTKGKEGRKPAITTKTLTMGVGAKRLNSSSASTSMKRSPLVLLLPLSTIFAAGCQL
jgi:hypothetical protein